MLVPLSYPNPPCAVFSEHPMYPTSIPLGCVPALNVPPILSSILSFATPQGQTQVFIFPLLLHLAHIPLCSTPQPLQPPSSVPLLPHQGQPPTLPGVPPPHFLRCFWPVLVGSDDHLMYMTSILRGALHQLHYEGGSRNLAVCFPAVLRGCNISVCRLAREVPARVPSVLR